MSEKKYLVSGLKDGQEYFYKDLEAHERVDDLQNTVDTLGGDFTALSSSVNSALKDKVSARYFDSTVTELNNKIDGIKIPDEFKYENIKDDVDAAIKKAADSTWNQHTATLAKVEREIKRFHHQGQSFEVRGLPDGSLVDYNCKEIRVMCPADTDWENYHIDLKKNFKEADLEQFRFIEFVAYAPEGADSYKEKVSYDYPEKLYESSFKVPFVENDPYDYAGIDSDKRKYSLYYFPVAQKVDGQWNYLGNISTIEDYNGWYYSIEWYDENNQEKVVKASTVRVNLAGVDNFRYIEPTHEHSIWAKYLDLSEKYEALLTRIETLEGRRTNS